jgi:hypothetical protein
MIPIDIKDTRVSIGLMEVKMIMMCGQINPVMMMSGEEKVIMLEIIGD